VNKKQMNDSQILYIQSPKLNQLNILKEVYLDAQITQDELASHCSLSVAMVNKYMKELCRAGYMEYHRKKIKNVTYHLTPLGGKQLEVLWAEVINEMVEMLEAKKERIWDRIFLSPDGVIIADSQSTEEILQNLQPLLCHGINLIRLDVREEAGREQSAIRMQTECWVSR
jgi:predicted transcriptional regulator